MTIESPRPEIAFRNTSWIDDGLARKGLGRLEIVLRVSDRPTSNVTSAGSVTLRQAGRDLIRRRSVDSRSIVTFDSLRVGQYEIITYAMGHVPTRAVVPVFPGCRTDVEVYVGIMSVGIAPPPPERSMVRITTCRDER